MRIFQLKECRRKQLCSPDSSGGFDSHNESVFVLENEKAPLFKCTIAGMRRETVKSTRCHLNHVCFVFHSRALNSFVAISVLATTCSSMATMQLKHFADAQCERFVHCNVSQVQSHIQNAYSFRKSRRRMQNQLTCAGEMLADFLMRLLAVGSFAYTNMDSYSEAAGPLENV